MSAVTGLYSPAGQGWRLAYSLVTLAHELASVYGDQLTCLGTVGDVAHAAEAMGSDHNPFIRDPAAPSIGIVRAIDLGGSDALLKQIRQHIWDLYAAQDARVYEFGYSKGCSDNLINNWGLPFGTHVDTGDAGHLHVSVTQVNGNSPSPSGYVAAIDSTAVWGFAGDSPSGGGTPITPEEDEDMLFFHVSDAQGHTYIVDQGLKSKTHIASGAAEAAIQSFMTAHPGTYLEMFLPPEQMDAIPDASSLGAVTVNTSPTSPAPTPAAPQSYAFNGSITPEVTA